NVVGATSTTLTGIGELDDQAYSFAKPNNGTTKATSKALGFDSDQNIGFDIIGSTGFATLTVGGSTQLYTIDPTTGAATLVGSIGAAPTVLSDMAVSLSTDTIAPTVTSITKLDADPNHTNSVRFLVTFSEAVTGVDATDFALAVTGITG